jgi:hypothetical protein
MTAWIKTQSNAPDPLANYMNRPIISGGGSDLRYAGRVIIELWDQVDTANASAAEDAQRLAISADAVNGDDAGLTKRITAALPAHVSRFHPFGA